MYKLLMSELARFAEKRSKLLSQEASLWQEFSNWAGQVDISAITEVRPIEQANTLGNKSKTTLSPQEAAEFLGLSKQTLAKLRVYGGGPEFVKIGRRVVYRKQKLDEFLSDKARPHTSSYSLHDQARGRGSR